MGHADRETQLKSKKKTNVKQLHCPLICLFRLASVELIWSPVNTSDPVDTMIYIPVLCAVGMGWVLHCHCEHTSASLTGISRHTASTRGAQTPVQLQLHRTKAWSNAEPQLCSPGSGAGVPPGLSPVPQCSRQGWLGSTPHRPAAVQHPEQAQGSGALCGSTACGRQHQLVPKVPAGPLGSVLASVVKIK